MAVVTVTTVVQVASRCLRAPNQRPASAYYMHPEATVFDKRPDLLELSTFGAIWASAVRSNA